MYPIPVTRYFRDTKIAHYAPLPTQIFTLGLSSTAVLVYALLLYRGSGSRKNGYTDEAGWVYVIYPQEALARDLGLKVKIIQKHLKALEEAGLILRRRPVGNRAARIFLNIPAASESTAPTGSSVPPGVQKSTGSPGQKVPAIKDKNNVKDPVSYYQHGEEESL